MTQPRTTRTALAALLTLGTLACGGEAASEAPVVERRDSAGVAIVENRGGDHALDWRFEEVLRLGGTDDGPEAFFQPTIATDARGRIYVLDMGEHRVSVFDSTGRHLRTFGSEGGGPGELQRPAQIAVTDDGTVGVQDWGKGAIVRWDSAGRPIEQLRLRQPMLWELRSTGDGFAGKYAMMSGFGEAADSTRYRLEPLGADGDTAAIATLAVAPGRPVDLGCVRISSMAPLFQPDLDWTVVDGRFVVAPSARYEVELRERDGRLTGIVRRDVEPQPATAELAKREVGDSMRVGFGGGGECVAPPEKVVEQRGTADVVPAIRGIIASPDGGWWVSRGVGEPEERQLDVFAADGEYVGTLPAGTPVPRAFLTPDLAVRIERDDLDLPYVVVYRIVRS